MTKAFENGTGGLVLISSSSPSAASSVSFTNLTVGKRYRLLANLSSSNSGAGLSFRFRENTTDKTTGYYGGGYQVNNVSGTTNLAWNNASVWDLNTLSNASSSDNFVDADISIVSATQALVNAQLYSVQTAYAAFQSVNNNSMTNCNGFSLYPASGTFTGKIKLYEYR